MTVVFEIIRHLFLLVAVIYCLFVLAFVVGRPLMEFHEHWFVRDAIRFVRCPNCGTAKTHDGRSSLRLLLSPPPPPGTFSSRAFGRFVRCFVCDAVMFAYSRGGSMPGLGTWHGGVEFEVLDNEEEAHAIIAQQPQLWLLCLFFRVVVVVAALVCAGFLIRFYVHSIIAAVSLVVLMIVLSQKSSKPKSTM